MLYNKIFVRCYRCKELKGCELKGEIKSCSVRGCSTNKKKLCVEQMRRLISKNGDGHRAFKCVMCAYTDDKSRLAFSSDE